MNKGLTAIPLGFLLLTHPAFSQSVKLAKVALGMSDNEVKEALSSSAPHYIQQPSDFRYLHYLIAETKEESFAFTLIEGRVAGFSLVHILPPGQQPFLAAGQEPTVKVLRDLVIAQTWTPNFISKGDTVWLSDAAGAPITGASNCASHGKEDWLSFAGIPGSTEKATADLVKPAMITYPANCGVAIHLSETPAESDDDRVRTVHIQVLDLKGLSAFLSKQQR